MSNQDKFMLKLELNDKIKEISKESYQNDLRLEKQKQDLKQRLLQRIRTKNVVINQSPVKYMKELSEFDISQDRVSYPELSMIEDLSMDDNELKGNEQDEEEEEHLIHALIENANGSLKLEEIDE